MKRYIRNKFGVALIAIGAVLIFSLTTSQTFAGSIIGYDSSILVSNPGFENTTPAHLYFYNPIASSYLAENLAGTIDFGDGSQESFSFSGPTAAIFIIEKTHMYVDSGPYAITMSGSGNYFSMWDPDGEQGSDTYSSSGTVSVLDVLPQVEAGGPYYLSAPGQLTLNGSATDPSPADAALLTYMWIITYYPNGPNVPGNILGVYFDVSTPPINFDQAGYYTGLLWAIEPGVATNTDKCEIYLGSTSSVPEPSTILLLGAGLAGVGLLRKKIQ